MRSPSPSQGVGPGKVVSGAVELLSEFMVDHYAQKRGIVVTLAPQKIAKMVPKWSRCSILRILWILKPLSIDSSEVSNIDSILVPFLVPF